MREAGCRRPQHRTSVRSPQNGYRDSLRYTERHLQTLAENSSLWIPEVTRQDSAIRCCVPPTTSIAGPKPRSERRTACSGVLRVAAEARGRPPVRSWPVRAVPGASRYNSAFEPYS